MKNDEEIIKMKEQKNEIEKLERKKSVLYKKKFEQYITTEQFKIEYTRVKEEIEKFKNLLEKISNSNCSEQKEKRLKEIMSQIENGNFIDNAILKDIIERIEVYPKNKIEIVFNI